MMNSLLNIQCHFLGLNDNGRLREMIHPPLLRMQDLVLINSAVVVLERQWNGGPRFAARVHLVVPGPDIHAEARDYTLLAAWRKVCENLEKQIERRKTKQAVRVKSKRQQPISKTCRSRPAFPP